MKKIKIKTFHLHLLSNASFVMQQTWFEKHINVIDMDKFNIKDKYILWKNRYEIVCEANKIKRKSQLAEDITILLKETITTYYAIKKIAKTYLKHYDSSVKKSAGNIIKVFDIIGNVYPMEMNKQIVSIRKIIYLLTTKFNEDVEKIGAAEWLERLENQYNRINPLYRDRISELAMRTRLNFRAARINLTREYNDICKIINALVIISPTDDLKLFIRKLNEINKKFIVRRRKTKDNNDDEKSDL